MSQVGDGGGSEGSGSGGERSVILWKSYYGNSTGSTLVMD